MNKNLLESQWAQIREILSEKFSHLTEEDIRQINGQYDQLVTKLQQKYGYSKEEAEDRIRSWNFDRVIDTKAQAIHDEKIQEEDNSSFFKWLLALCLPLLLLGLYFLGAPINNEMTKAPVMTQEQVIVQTPADLALSNNIQNALISDQTLAFNPQNIQITSNNGVVTLSGFVPTQQAHDSILNITKNYAGVTQVVDHLQIK